MTASYGKCKFPDLAVFFYQPFFDTIPGAMKIEIRNNKLGIRKGGGPELAIDH